MKIIKGIFVQPKKKPFFKIVSHFRMVFIFWGCFLISCAQADEPCWGTFKTADGQELRTILYDVPKSNGYPLTIIFLQGRASFIERYQDVLEKLNGMGYRVWSFDWRGQGGSPHTFPQQPHKLHIDSFDTYLADLDLFIREKIRSQTAAPLVLMGSSSGGHLAFRYLEDYPGKVQGAILISPMLEVFTPPFPRFLAEHIAKLACWLGFGQSYVLGYSDFDPTKDSFGTNRVTHDIEKLNRRRAIILAHPALLTGGITYGWANAMLTSFKKQNNSSALKNITVPVLVLEGDRDRVVDHSQNDRFEEIVPTLTRIIYQDAHHHLPIERDDITVKFWEDIASFLKHKF